MVTVILRFYDMDPSAKSLNSTRFQQFWGFADPPKVEHLVKKKVSSKRSTTTAPDCLRSRHGQAVAAAGTSLLWSKFQFLK